VSSERTDRHRLHRGGTGRHQRLTEITRCLKRYIAREDFPTCSRPRPAQCPGNCNSGRPGN